MSPALPRYRGVLVGGIAVLLVGGIVWALQREPVSETAGWPSPQEIDSLGRYLQPVSPAPNLDDYAVYLPAGPEPRPIEWIGQAPPEPDRERRLSAILIAGGRPMAIIDDAQVRPGERLEGGAVVVSIARDHVVIQERSGIRRTLRLFAGNEGNP